MKLSNFLFAIGAVTMLAMPAGAEPRASDDTEVAAPVPQRKVSINGRAATPSDLQIISALEQALGRRLPDGAYWYDPMNGAAGEWGGPIAILLPAGMSLGGKLPANASGGGKGNVTNVFVNGRELHPHDVRVFQWIFGNVPQGRYVIDHMGNVADQRGYMIANIGTAIQNAMRAKGKPPHVKNGLNANSWVSGGCVSVRVAGGGDYSSAGCG